MNFRERTVAQANDFYEEASKLKLFTNNELLSKKVGSNQRYLRKVNIIQNLGLYKDLQFIAK